ncbi:MAG: M1 family metallopeptidase [Crocinitomicaceae bacterium]
MKRTIFAILMLIAVVSIGQGNDPENNKFKQMKDLMATPNVYRTASGAPGHEYYQQKADYKMEIRLDDESQKISGEEWITYSNNSPDQLEYLWLQLDQNMRSQTSDSKKVSSETMEDMSFWSIARMTSDFDGGFKIEAVMDASGSPLNYTINKTMMRIDLDRPLASKGSITFKVKWWYNINDRMKVGGRSGYEYFKEEGNYLYTIAQFFPRMCVYNDVEGWQNKQFLGRGEFTLPFGDYEVKITVPNNHIVAATGELQNSSSVMTKEQQDRLRKARTSRDKPIMIITPEEALKNEKSKSEGNKTWIFKAKNVRDFAFASSKKFIWDAMDAEYNGKHTLAMSFYPKEGNPLWEQYSTRIVAHTIKTYSKFTIDYPYPVAISVHSNHIGMEYPMICFNGGRPEADGTYSEQTKYGMWGVIIHEVGHNFFPMIINSDERQWTWMDEGLNTFVQYLTQEEWERDYPSRRGPAYKIVDYMKGDKSNISPIMTNSESIFQFGNNAYGKPATALNILRETIMGRELFDHAFKVYCERWKFKHPSPEDFFRTMEDASGVDLDWFWRGWFYTTDHVDISLENVRLYTLNTGDPAIEKKWQKEQEERKNKFIGDIRNDTAIVKTMDERYPELLDFYNKWDPYSFDSYDIEQYEQLKDRLSAKDKEILESNYLFYQLDFKNIGGLVMPIIIKFSFTDGTEEVERIPAEIWRQNNYEVSKVFIFKKELANIELDPYLETADTELNNNNWPKKVVPSRYKLFMERKTKGHYLNPMQRVKSLE